MPMNLTTSIVVFYSYGPQYKRAVCAMREAYPEAYVTAVVPPSYPASLLTPWADAVETWAPEPGSRVSAARALNIISRLRQKPIDMLVVLFDSPKLQVLSSLSGARQRYCYGLDGRLKPVRLTLVAVLVKNLGRAVRGRLLYARIWLHVHATRIKTDPSMTSEGKERHD